MRHTNTTTAATQTNKKAHMTFRTKEKELWVIILACGPDASAMSLKRNMQRLPCRFLLTGRREKVKKKNKNVTSADLCVWRAREAGNAVRHTHTGLTSDSEDRWW